MKDAVGAVARRRAADDRCVAAAHFAASRDAGAHTSQAPGTSRAARAMDGPCTALHAAATGEEVASILDALPGPDARRAALERRTRGDRYTPLHVAARAGRAGAVAALLERGADPFARDDEGSVPLHHAVGQLAATGEHRGFECVDLLVAAMAADGRGVSVPDSRGITPAMIAAGDGEADALATLLRAEGADRQDPALLHYAAWGLPARDMWALLAPASPAEAASAALVAVRAGDRAEALSVLLAAGAAADPAAGAGLLRAARACGAERCAAELRRRGVGAA